MPKYDSNTISIAIQHGCCPVNLLHIFRKPFPRNTSWWLLRILLGTAVLRNLSEGLFPNVYHHVANCSEAILHITIQKIAKTFQENLRGEAGFV